jgi:LysR family transcriptional regulator, low CO2-responsive transcriptional regulator
MLEKYFQHDGIQPKMFLELGNLEAVKETVRRGLGVTVLSPWVARRELEAKSLVAFPLGKRKLRRNWCIMHSLQTQYDLAAATFVKLCHESTQPMNFRL